MTTMSNSSRKLLSPAGRMWWLVSKVAQSCGTPESECGQGCRPGECCTTDFDWSVGSGVSPHGEKSGYP
jgi:hypothetical protein